MAMPLHPELVYFVLKACPPTWRLDNPAIRFYELMFVLEGSADYVIDGSPYHVRAGQALFLTPGSSRRAGTAGMSCAALDFVLGPGEEVRLPTVTDLSAPEREELERYFREINYEWLQQGPGSAVRAHAYFLLALHRMLYGRTAERRNPHVERIKRHIVEHYGEKLTVHGLAASCGLHPAYCGALFKQAEGCSIAAYLQRVRVRKAADLLETGEYAVGEVAEMTGFGDIYYFSAVFKRVTGVPPSVWRRRSPPA